MPPAYFIANVEVLDTEAWKEYAAGVTKTVADYDGEFLVRRGSWESLEGQKPFPVVVVIKFPSLLRAKEWFNSEEYRPLSALRQSSSRGNLFIAEGLG
jgi:uncharacterized protein (DUF1330 family)